MSSNLAKKRHQKQLKRNVKRRSVRQNVHQRRVESKLKRQKEELMQMELGTILNKMLDECDVNNYEEWVAKLDLRPELRQQLDHIVSEERKRIEEQGKVWSETIPLNDEVIERLIATGDITQEQLDAARSFTEDGEQLEWNPETKSIMTAPQMFGDDEEDPETFTTTTGYEWKHDYNKENK